MDDAQPIDDELLATGVRRHLRQIGRVWDAPVLAFVALGSTNDLLKALARDGAREWTVVVAREQTHGRGRQGRAWQSPPGNLYLSFLLRPAPDAAAGLLPLMAGVALVEAARGWGVEARLKWPNDLHVGERKLAGVLVEAAGGRQGLDHAVVGVGVNLDWDPADVPELATQATSLRREVGQAPEVAPAAAALLAELPAWYGLLLRDPTALVCAWRERALPWWGERVQADTGGRTLRGRLLDVRDDGALRLCSDDGTTHTLFSGDVARLRPDVGAP
jgi:BirA family biotin operon repressor/biotin-[acetyl-CoA-carboxylase] ligase